MKGRVRANLVEIDGDFEGEVRAETLRVGVGASARGKFFAGRISLVDGARLEGDVNPFEPALRPNRSVRLRRDGAGRVACLTRPELIIRATENQKRRRGL